MGQPKIMDASEGGPPPRLRLWNFLIVILEWSMAAVAIMACGMLFSALLIPDWRMPNKTASLVVTRPPLILGAKPTTERPEVLPNRITEYDRVIDLPDIFDTSDWPESNRFPRQQPFMDALRDLNFTQPQRRPSDYRLSGDDIPTLYEVDLRVWIRGIDGATESKFEGKSLTHFKRVGAVSSTVELHVFGMYIEKASLVCDGRNLKVVKHRRDDNVKQSLIVTVEEEIETGMECILELVWTQGRATTDNAGVYETWYTRDDGTLSIGLTTHGESMHTRKWMPCFDEPRYKASLKLSIEYPSHLTALSNGRAVPSEKTGGRTITSFEPTWPLSSYLYTFSITDYVKQDTIVDGLPVSVYVPPPLASHLPKAVQDVEEIIPPALETFNVVHLNSKLDFIFFPDHTSAMENPGHISLDTSFLHAKATLTHEMMHQYFGNLITLEWWSDLWVNEGLANYYEDIAMYGNRTLDLLRSLRGMRDQSIGGDIYDTSLPLHRAVNTFIESRMMFRNPYSKGGIVINMLREYVGKEDFDAVVWKILNERANSTLSLPQFYDYLGEIRGEKGENGVKIARDFMEQIGYPLLLIRHLKDTTVIRQVRFHKGFVKEQQRDFDTRWTIPIHLTTLYGTYTHTFVMDNNVSEMTVNHRGILIVDPSRVVNYRVVYDRHTYEAIRRSPLTEEDKDFIELDLVEATSLGYTDAIATYDVIMKRKSKEVFLTAYQKMLTLFGAENAKNAKEILERISGHKLTKRQNSDALLEHPLRQRRGKYVSDEMDKDDADGQKSEEEGWFKKKISYCATISNITDALRDYNKLDKSGRRDTKSLKCILTKITETENFKIEKLESWIDNLFNNHFHPGGHTFHNREFLGILHAVEENTKKTAPNFVQNYIVEKLPEKIHYYETKLLNALPMFTIKHLEQLKTLIETHPKAAAENWVDIANIFERFQASNDEGEILGPKLIEALKILTEGGMM